MSLQMVVILPALALLILPYPTIMSIILSFGQNVRKDVEQLFGTLKFRFRWLMGPILYHDLETINYAVRTYTIAYGMNDFDCDDNTDSLGLRKPMS